MDLSFHGGHCCGIKTIHGFNGAPSTEIHAVAKAKPNNYDAFPSDFHLRKHDSFFTDGAPQESLLERLERLVAFCKRERPAGMIEVVLADCNIMYHNPDIVGYRIGNMIELWSSILKQMGFVETLSWMNSNSGNRCVLFNLVYDGWNGKTIYDLTAEEDEEDDD